ncbi:MAG: amidohydrolase [Candidatus Brocadiia bacterium]
MKAIAQKAQSLQPKLVGWRRKFHPLAELSREESGTTAAIEAVCKEHGLRVLRYGGMNGLCADSPVESNFAVALRADIDALPGPEESGLEFAARGQAAHLCGHDMHIAMILGAYVLLASIPDAPRVRLVFQPAEESPPGGAVELIARGALDGMNAALALHVNPLKDVGFIGSRSGPYFAAADNFDIVVTGKGGHAASPHLCHDAILAASQIVVAAQAIVARNVPSIEPAVLSIASFVGGTNYNVLPDSVTLKGTIRSFDEELQNDICLWTRKLAEEIGAAHGCTAKMRLIKGYSPLVNDVKAVAAGRLAAEELFGTGTLDSSDGPHMFGEDFGAFTQKVPGALFFIGAGVEKERYPLHNSKVVFNEDVLWRGAAFLAATALTIAEENRR